MGKILKMVTTIGCNIIRIKCIIENNIVKTIPIIIYL